MDIVDLPFFQHVKWRPDARELRRFAIAMLVGFGLLGLLWAWRANEIATGSIVLWTIGVVLAVAAFVPGLGRVAYLSVYLPSSFVGYFVSHIILVLMFFLIITPLGLILRLMGKDPLRQKRPQHESGWLPIEGDKQEGSYYRQF